MLHCKRAFRARALHGFVRLVHTLLALLVLSTLDSAAVMAAPSAALTRYPYLTDSIQTSITVNWATTTAGGTAGSVKWGPAGSCTANTTPATKTNISVNSVAEYQWMASIPVTPDTSYCYRVFQGGTDLLASDPSPSFMSQVAVNSSAPFSFAVFGDWGQAYAASVNVDQANVLSQIAQSGARFAVMTGDTGYPGGDQTNYGDLQQTGTDVSGVFGPAFWGVPGRSIPVFNVTGNHGFTNGTNQVVNWPETNAVSTSGGRYLMENYPSINGSIPKSYPSFWYAFDAGRARFYALTTAWAEGNIGSGTVYANDAAAHWTPGSAEYQWLQNDLATHPSALKFAFWHYPLFADSAGQPSDTALQGGPGTLQGLLNANNVNIVFNGHAHGYERNKPDPAGMVSYVFGNGGAALGTVSGCSAFDLYALGAGGSHCGAAPAGLSNDHVFGFAKVTIDGQQVTVTPTDELGRTFDVQTYTFPSNETDSQPPTVPQNLTATGQSGGIVNLAWSASTDNIGVTGYRIYRDGEFLATSTGAATTYQDNTVTPSRAYGYQVTALDAAGNESARQATPVTVTPPGSPDTQAPSSPGNLTATAPASSIVNLSWTASSDNVRVIGYFVYRDLGNGAALLKSEPDNATTFQDEAATPNTTYIYQVSAFDAAGNESARSSITVTTPASTSGGGGTLTFAPTDDATIDASNPNTVLGTASRITVDQSPVNDFLVKFTVTGTGAGTSCPTIASAKLRLTVGNTSNDNSDKGGNFRAAVNSSWSEASVTWNSAPAAVAGGPVASITTPVVLGTAYLVDATSLITGNGPITIRASGNSNDGARYYSRNGNAATLAPELQLTCGGSTPDIAPPTQPGTPTLSGVTPSSISMSWTPSTDDVGVTGYRIFRNGTQVGTTGGSVTSYQDTGLSASTNYNYTLKAVDAVGNASPESGSLSATTSTNPDTPPTAPGTPTVTGVTDTTVDLSWAASTDDHAVTGYRVFRNGSQVATTSGTDTTYTDAGLTPSTTYSYTIQAVDGASNSSPLSGAATATTSAPPDTSPPSQPGTPTVVPPVTESTVILNWVASTDDVGVIGYCVFRDGSQVASTSGTDTSYTDTGLTPSTTYSYTIQAFDAANNRSSLSGALSVTTADAPPPPPAAPTGVTATPGDAQVSLSWTASSGATSYSVKRGTVTGGPYTTVSPPNLNATTYTDTGLTNGTQYFYVVTASNAAGESPNSTEVNATPTAPPLPPPAPSGVTATAGNAQVSLSWTASSGATSYTVKRGTVTGGPYTPVSPPNLSATTYTDTGLTNGTRYFYVVTAVNTAGESGNSTEVNATPTAPPVGITLVNQTNVTSTAAVTSVTATIPSTTAGNTLVVVSSLFTGATKSLGTVVDSSGASWSSAEKIASATSGSNGRVEIWWHSNVPAGVTSVTLSQPSGQAAITKWGVKVLELNGVRQAAALDTSGSAANSAVTILKSGLSGAVAASGEFVVGAVATSGATPALTLAQGSSTPTSGWVALTDVGTGTTTTDVMGRAAYFTSTTAGSQYQAAWSTSASKSGGGAVVVFKAGP